MINKPLEPLLANIREGLRAAPEITLASNQGGENVTQHRNFCLPGAWASHKFAMASKTFCVAEMDRVTNGLDWEAAFLTKFPIAMHGEKDPLPFLETSVMMFDVANLPSTKVLRQTYDTFYNLHYHSMSVYYEQGFIMLPFWDTIHAIEPELIRSTLEHKGAHKIGGLQQGCQSRHVCSPNCLSKPLSLNHSTAVAKHREHPNDPAHFFDPFLAS
jgi:hypothetical protein